MHTYRPNRNDDIILTNDPDDLTCHTDHAADIERVGECRYCGSRDAWIVEHVLPELERHYECDPVEAAVIVYETGPALFDGIPLDHEGAVAILTVYIGLTEEHSLAALRGLPLDAAISICREGRSNAST